MGRNYYCEYCDKRFKDGSDVRKKHIDGLPHQTARKEHYARFKSPEEILHEERLKKPCAKFPQCLFGAGCRFSHYSPLQLAQLQQQADHARQLRLNPQPKIYSTALISEFMQKREQARVDSLQREIRENFKYPKALLKNIDELPPSLRPLDAKMLGTDLKVTFFGDI